MDEQKKKSGKCFFCEKEVKSLYQYEFGEKKTLVCGPCYVKHMENTNPMYKESNKAVLNTEERLITPDEIIEMYSLDEIKERNKKNG